MAYDGHGIGTAITGAGTTLSNLKDICKYHGWQDQTTAGIEACRRFINRTLRMLTILAPWPEYHKRNGRITLATNDEDYVCTNASDANITNISKIGAVIRDTRMSPLDEIPGGVDEWLLKKTTSPGSGVPREYTFRKYVSAGDILMELLVYPKPSSAEDGTYLYYSYYLSPVELVNNSDVTDWPDVRLWLLEEALEKRMASKDRDTIGVALEGQDFMMLVHRAMVDSRPSYMPIPLTPPTDARLKSLREIEMRVQS